MKISKTIKRLRSEQSITQEQLAEKLFISRQAVSSWENDRTQPDLEMLGKLSEVFGVSIEELVYGKKRNTNLENEKTNYNITLIVVFSVLGALLVGTGLILIFVTFWQRMPQFIKGILSFLPLLMGQGAGLFVLTKKKDKISWCEGGSIFWTAGIAASFTMLYKIFALNIEWFTAVFITGVLILSVVMLLRAVAPLIFFYGCILTGCFLAIVEHQTYSLILLTLILCCAGLFFSYSLVKKEKKSHRSLYSYWISILALGVFFGLTAFGIEDGFILCNLTIGAFGIALLLLSFKDNDISMPYRLPGLLLTSFMLIFSGAVPPEAIGNTYEFYTKPLHYVFTAVMLLGVVLLFIFVRKTEKDKILLSYIAVSVFVLTIFLISAYIPHNYIANAIVPMINFLKAVAFGANILLMISGSREKKLLPINLGFISVAIITLLVVYESGLSQIGAGVLLLVFGVVLLAINFRISKFNQKKETEHKIAEVETDE